MLNNITRDGETLIAQITLDEKIAQLGMRE